MTDCNELQRERAARRDAFRARADRLLSRFERASGDPHSRLARIATHAGEQLYEHDNPEFVKALSLIKRVPVTIDEFLESKDFLAGVEFDIWPALKEDVRQMNPDVMVGETPVHEIMLGGATGTGKTHTSMATLAYQTYLTTCFYTPQRLFGLTPHTPLVFMFQSVAASVTKRVIYQPFRDMVTSMPYFRRFVPVDDRVTSELTLVDQKVKLVPALASLNTILGQAVMGALLDEVNFMQVIEKSTKIPGPDGMGGKFDQAEIIYTNITRRRRRSFTTRGVSIGCICTISSTRYQNDFLDRRIAEVEKYDIPNTFRTRHKQYEVNPKYNDPRISAEPGQGHRFGAFRIAVGNDESPTTILEDHMEAGVHYPASAEVLDVPMPYKPDFQKDPDAALRDIIGIATAAINPFIKKRQKINDAVSRGRERGLPQLVATDEVFLATEGMPEFLPENFPVTRAWRNKSRWVHVDLSRVNDRCGIAMLRLDGFTTRQSTGGMTLSLPKFTVELAVGIKPSVTTPIDIAEVRGWVMQLARDHGINIEGVSFDGFDSRETIQALNNSGIRAKTISMDLSPEPHEAVRDALYEDRMDIQPEVELLLTELRTLEYHANTNKVDHPPNGSKDVADCVAGALQNALESRIVRSGIEYMTDDDPADGNVQPPRFRVQRERVRTERERPVRPPRRT